MPKPEKERFIDLVSLNIDGDTYFPEVREFLLNLRRDGTKVMLLQEVFATSFENLCAILEMNGRFFPLIQKPTGSLGIYEEWGLAILVASPVGFRKISALLYAGDDHIPLVNPENLPSDSDASLRRGLLVANLDVVRTPFRVATTKFTWFPGGVTEEQGEDFTRMSQLLSIYPDIILGADMNSPRGGELWQKLLERYTDNIPADVSTTLDPQRHRTNGRLEVVVDGLFTSAHYRTNDIRVIPGVSDHCAITARIYKTLPHN